MQSAERNPRARQGPLSLPKGAIARNIAALRRWLANGLARRAHLGIFGFGAFYLLCGALVALANFSGKYKSDQRFRVFGSFWASGLALSRHQNPYGVYPLTYYFKDFVHHRVLVSLNLSPPTLLPFFQLLSHFNPESAIKVWTFTSLLLFLSSLALLLVEYGGQIQRRQILWFLLGPTAFDTMFVGQDYAVMLACIVIGWILIEHNRYAVAGILIGILIAAKPNLALCPVFLALCGYMRIAKASVVTILAMALFALLLYGPGVYTQWWQAIANDPHWIFPTDVSLTGFATRLGVRVVGQVFSIVLLTFTIVLVARKRTSAANAIGLSLCVGMLASPLAWLHYAIFLTPVLLRKPWNLPLSIAMLMLMLPTQVGGIARHISLTAVNVVSLVYFLPICYIYAHFVRSTVQESRDSTELNQQIAVPAQ